ncbi:MAG TPA: hypothetical protein VFK47_08645, partial [Ktedonobacteraceae bacterium]|nr:hypothetical protein [Ktedonobacteraceae bacterium]
LAKYCGTIFPRKPVKQPLETIYSLFLAGPTSMSTLNNCMRPELPTLFVYLKYSVYVLCVQPAACSNYQG